MFDRNAIICGDCRDVLDSFPEKSIFTCVTSPPYWALRNYATESLVWDNWEGSLGLEPTFKLYIKHLCDIFDQVHRVLRDDGSLWVNIGDTYSTQGGQNRNTDNDYSDYDSIQIDHKMMGIPLIKSNELPAKSLTLVPFRFAIEMLDRGWILRNTIIWHKRSCLPSPVKDRFTVDFEYMFFFTKNQQYYFEQQFEPYSSVSENVYRSILRQGKNYNSKLPYNSNFPYCNTSATKDYESAMAQDPSETKKRVLKSMIHSKGRNKRTVWTINPRPYKGSHFATFPRALVRSPIAAGCPEFVCRKCGMPRKKLYRSGKIVDRGKNNKYILHKGNINKTGEIKDIPDENRDLIVHEKIFTGYSDCECKSGFDPGIVLDIFGGSGTTGVEALSQRKDFVLIELNPDYVKMARERIKPLLSQPRLLTFFENMTEVTIDD